MAGHVVSRRTYSVVFATLLGLTALTTGAAFIDLGALNTVLALAIAVIKMLLVILFFMHVRYSSQLTKLIVVAAFFWFAILLTFSLSDIFTRRWTPIPSGWEAPAASTAPARPQGNSRSGDGIPDPGMAFVRPTSSFRGSLGCKRPPSWEVRALANLS